MKLVLLVQKNAWFVEHLHAWYRVNEQHDIGLAMNVLTLSIASQRDLVEQPHQAGCARVTHPNNNKLQVELKSPDNKIIDIVDIQLDEYILCDVEWKTKQYRDGWMTTDATLLLNNVGSMYLDAYLPPRENSKGKTLYIVNERTSKVRTFWMPRARKTRVVLLEKGNKEKVKLKLNCEPEPIDQITDPRKLGFVLVAEEAHPF